MANTNQVKITLSDQMLEYAESLSQQYGTTTAGVFKFLLMKKAEEMKYPIFQASETTENLYQETVSSLNTTIPVNNVDDFFDQL